MSVAVIYTGLFILCLLIVTVMRRFTRAAADFTSLKTVTFGDESAVKADRIGSVLSVVVIILIWGAFTGSAIAPIKAPPPFTGTTSFTYTVQSPDGTRDDAMITVAVGRDATAEKPEVEPGDGPAMNDSAATRAWNSALILFDRNDEWKRKDGARIVAINGQPIEPGGTVNLPAGAATLTGKGAINFKPDPGWQMQPLYLPSPEATWDRFTRLRTEGYKNDTLPGHLFWSLFRVTVGFFVGALVGIPLGYAMGLSGWARGWFDPIVEFMRPIPPLALIPLVIIWFGIGEQGKIVLLFLAALWIMAIAARSGVAGVNISKIHAAYSLGARKWQILRYVIMPNSLPDIFTGARVAMGVCWGTVVAAELVAASEGTGMMIMDASRFQLTDIVIIGIVMIGVIGACIELLVRAAERLLIPWKGRG
ncbi:MAG: ABC transporter permease [Rhodobacteraceae bacterium]|nr:ABC transporter permease [Paracoccaceae bacterium]